MNTHLRPRDNPHPPKDPSRPPAYRPYVHWPLAQLSNWWAVRDFDTLVGRHAVALFPHCCHSAPTAPSMQYSSSLAGLTPELVELLLNHMSRERLLRPRTLELFFGCPLQKFVLNCYPYSTNELLRQLRAFTALRHLSLVNSPLITGNAVVTDFSEFAASALFTHFVCFAHLFPLVLSRLRAVGSVQFGQTPVPQPGLM